MILAMIFVLKLALFLRLLPPFLGILEFLKDHKLKIRFF